MHLARANMVIHEWDKAIEYAQVVIDNIPMLTNENQILQGFSNISLPDVVFGCDITADNSTCLLYTSKRCLSCQREQFFIYILL